MARQSSVSRYKGFTVRIGVSDDGKRFIPSFHDSLHASQGWVLLPQCAGGTVSAAQRNAHSKLDDVLLCEMLAFTDKYYRDLAQRQKR